MAGIGNVSLAGNVSGQPTGQRTLGPLVITAPTAVDATNVVAVSIGANTITIPTGATVMIVTGPNAAYPQPNPAYGGVLTLKGVSGDTGIAISAKNPTMLTWDAVTPAPATMVINASVATSVELWFM